MNDEPLNRFMAIAGFALMIVAVSVAFLAGAKIAEVMGAC